MSSVRLDQIYQRSERIVGRDYLGEFILVPIVGKGADLTAIFATNVVGATIWKALDGVRHGTDIVAMLAQEYRVDVPKAEIDYLKFIEDLVSVAAVSEVAEPD